jgi:2-dehydropantoate 2-reductase
MGIVFGAALQRVGHDVTFLGRAHNESATRLPSEIALHSLAGSLQHVPIKATRDPAIAASADLILVLVKTPDTPEAVTRVAPFVLEETPVLTLQNGLGAAERVQTALGEHARVIAGVTSQAATRDGCCTVFHTGAGSTKIGSLDSRGHSDARRIAALFSDAGIPTIAVEQIDCEIWQKVAINAAINGLTALCEVENGAIASYPELQQLAADVAVEVAAVAAARGIDLAGIAQAVNTVAVSTARNRSSMLQDLDASRPTEADAIYGEIQRAASLEAIAIPRIDALAALLDAKSRAAYLKEKPVEPDA